MIRTRIALSGERVPDLLAEYRKQAGQVVQSAVEEATAGMLREFRANLSAAFPGSSRAPNLVTSKTFPDRAVSVDAAGSVVARGGKHSAWPAPLRLFAEGGTITPRSAGTALAIPTARVPSVGRRRMTPDEVQRAFKERLTMIPARRGGVWGYLVLYGQTIGRSGNVRTATARRAAQGHKAKPIVMFVLVPKVTVTKRLDFDAIATRWAGLMPSLLDGAARRIVMESRT